MHNKRGQGGLTTTELIVTLAVILTIAVVLIGAFGGFSKIFGLFGFFSGATLDSFTTVCKNVPTGYCDYKPVQIPGENDKRWLNCNYKPVLTALGSGEQTCTITPADECNILINAATEKKKSLKLVYVNEVPCSCDWDSVKNACVVKAATPPAAPNAGAQGGACRTSGLECDAGLACLSGVCVYGPAVP